MTLSLAAQAAILCLAHNGYFEARGQGFDEMVHVSHVVLNRVDSERYPDDVCDVIWAYRQFSWTLDGKSDKPKDQESWLMAQRSAVKAWYGEDTTGGALNYYAHAKVYPDWADESKETLVTWHTYQRQ